MLRKIKFALNTHKKFLVISLIVVFLIGIGIFNKPVIFAYNGSFATATTLKNNINKLVYLANSGSPEAFDYFIKVTKECYPDAIINITKSEFMRLISLSHKKNLTFSDKQFLNSVTNKLKSSYYGKKSLALEVLSKEIINNEIEKSIRDFMKNQHCNYAEAKKKALNALVVSNPNVAKEFGLTDNIRILSTPQTRENAFLFAMPYDVASVLSNWGDLFSYAVWVSHDGWVKEVKKTPDGKHIQYLNIYEALPDGNWDSVHRYGRNGKGAYNNWITNSLHVYIKRYPDYSLAERAYNVSVIMYYGKPYNYNIANKYGSNSSYCSQNIWTGFWSYRVNLDSNSDIPILYATGHIVAATLEITGVLPDSIYLSPYLEFVSSG